MNLIGLPKQYNIFHVLFEFLKVTWYRDGVILTGSRRRYKMSKEGNNHKLTVSDVQIADFGNFSCIAENSLGNSKRFWLLSGM